MNPVPPTFLRPVYFRPTPPRLQWSTDARFGVSFHFGLYSLPGPGQVGSISLGKTRDGVIRALVNCVSKSGNLTYNFGPTSRSALPTQLVQLLEELTKWTDPNAASIHGCGLAPLERPDWCRCTMSNDGRTLYSPRYGAAYGPPHTPRTVDALA